MFEILKKENLCASVVRMTIDAPLVAAKAQPGQFVILRVAPDGERIPLTVADYDRAAGTVTVIFQTVGATTLALSYKEVGECLTDFVGPLGRATDTAGLRKVAVIGGGVGCAIALPVAKKLYEQGTVVHCVCGFRSGEQVILQDEFFSHSHKLITMTDDGSFGEQGLVTDALRRLIESGETYDEVIAIGPIPMMKFVSLLTAEYGIKTVVSMNPIMIDGTGMCGGCRLTVGGQVKFACVDGPEFDGHQVDFDEVMQRSRLYQENERHAYEQACHLFQKEVQ
ncbi:MAG: sulfide/dihydroorotate dehydrogenase-like FAD/NAD-binding protein [Ruminococcaceae bacterium]|nr:sulfide/dihydroorotate dehydrogenase-like FAD/NAD-binding protein [Oscillospiraceae bacterium]